MKWFKVDGPTACGRRLVCSNANRSLWLPDSRYFFSSQDPGAFPSPAASRRTPPPSVLSRRTRRFLLHLRRAPVIDGGYVRTSLRRLQDKNLREMFSPGFSPLT